MLRIPRRSRALVAGVIAVVLVAGLLASVALPSTAAADGSVWLARWVTGEVSRVDPSGRVTGRIGDAGGSGHPFEVVQKDGHAYVLDPVTQQLKVLDVDHLNVSRSALFSGEDLEVVTGNGKTYVFDAATGRIQPINATTLANTRPAIEVGSPITGAIDKDGRLWVAESATGEVMPIVDGVAQAPVRVADPGAQLSITVVGDNVVVVNAATGDLVVIDRRSHDVRSRIKIPNPAGRRIALQVPADQGSSVWLAFGDGALAQVDFDSGRVDVSPSARPGHRLGPPTVTGDRVYVTDETAGDVVVFDAGSRKALAEPPRVAETGQRIDVVTDDHTVWVNVPQTPKAFTLDDGGTATPVIDEPSVASPAGTAPTTTIATPRVSTGVATPQTPPTSPTTPATTPRTTPPTTSLPPPATPAVRRTQIPVPRDYDGDRRADYGTWKPSDGVFRVMFAKGGSSGIQWGWTGDIPVPADYDGDGVVDLATWRPSDGVFRVLFAKGGSSGIQWGWTGDIPVPADYDGDKITDLAVWRPADGVFRVLFAKGGSSGIKWGMAGDIPVPADYDKDGIADLATWRPSDGMFRVQFAKGGGSAIQWGLTGDIPVPADYDGDSAADLATWRPSDGVFRVLRSTGGSVSQQWGD